MADKVKQDWGKWFNLLKWYKSDISGTISVPMSEIADFDLSNVSIEAELSSYDYDADLNVDEVSLEDHY